MSFEAILAYLFVFFLHYFMLTIGQACVLRVFLGVKPSFVVQNRVHLLNFTKKIFT